MQSDSININFRLADRTRQSSVSVPNWLVEKLTRYYGNKRQAYKHIRLAARFVEVPPATTRSSLVVKQVVEFLLATAG